MIRLMRGSSDEDVTVFVGTLLAGPLRPSSSDWDEAMTKNWPGARI